MKKQILGFALVAIMIGSVTAGCSSEKAGSSATAVDTAKMDSAKQAKKMARAERRQMQKDTATPAKTIEDTVKY